MTTEERLALLEKRLDDYDRMITRLIAYASLTRAGRMILKTAGISA